MADATESRLWMNWKKPNYVQCPQPNLIVSIKGWLWNEWTQQTALRRSGLETEMKLYIEYLPVQEHEWNCNAKYTALANEADDAGRDLLRSHDIPCSLWPGNFIPSSRKEAWMRFKQVVPSQRCMQGWLLQRKGALKHNIIQRSPQRRKNINGILFINITESICQREDLPSQECLTTCDACVYNWCHFNNLNPLLSGINTSREKPMKR
jgi:hypothetical protein